MSKIILQNLTKDYGNGKGVLDLNVEIKSGEFFVILGPSGCGKTTTLRLIAGLEIPDKGRIFLDDQDITDFPPKDRNMSMVFQNYALYPFMNVFDNIAFPLKKKKMKKDEISETVHDIAEVMGITDILDKKPGQISGGQRQRVALARAIVKNPKVFLMDEPLSNLDAKLRVGMRAELKRIQRRYATTTVYVTHDQVEAMTLADRVAVMSNAKLIQLDNPMNIYEKPVNTFVAGFVGDPPINFVETNFDKSTDSIILGNQSLKIPLKENNHPDKVILGIRPEDVFVVNGSGIDAQLTFIQPLGRRRIEHYKIEGTDKEIIRASSEQLNLNIGDKCKIDFRRDKILLFDPVTTSLISY